MLKSEAERIIKRVSEETNAQFTEEQMAALSEIIIRVASTIVEEALATYSPGKPGSRPQFFA